MTSGGKGRSFAEEGAFLRTRCTQLYSVRTKPKSTRVRTGELQRYSEQIGIVNRSIAVFRKAHSRRPSFSNSCCSLERCQSRLAVFLYRTWWTENLAEMMSLFWIGSSTRNIQYHKPGLHFVTQTSTPEGRSSTLPSPKQGLWQCKRDLFFPQLMQGEGTGIYCHLAGKGILQRPLNPH